MTKHTTDNKITAYSIYNVEQKRRTKINPLDTIYLLSRAFTIFSAIL